jgi:GNAT superfamily N-acetyltransferase
MSVSIVETNPADFTDFAALHALLSTSFAFMAQRIDPPASMSRMGVDDLRDKAAQDDLILIRTRGRPVACLFGRAQPDGYCLEKLAVAAAQRRRGLARQLIDAAAAQARGRALEVLQLQTRVELVENHAAFAAMGFVEVGRTAHPGYDRPTSVTMRKRIVPG